MTSPSLVSISSSFLENENLQPATFERWSEEAMDNPEAFWGKMAQRLRWMTPFQKVYTGDFAQGDNRWFEGGKLNISDNCLDRHLDTHPNHPALIWQAEEDNESETYTFKTLHQEVCKFANALKKMGVQKGDRVVTYLPMVPELAIALLACTRIGAVHSVVFAGFSHGALAARVDDCTPKVIITADIGFRAGKRLAIKQVVDDALSASTHSVAQVVVVARKERSDITLIPNRDIWWHEAIDKEDTHCLPLPCDAQDPLFILYTSGSTGKPKGIIHSTGGYLLGVDFSFWAIFDPKPNDIHWCSADIGWITGHSYVLYGPLSQGITSFMYEGTPTFPHPGRWWELIDRYQINIFYTAPTAIRMLEQVGNEVLAPYSLKSLRLLGSVGEPINPAAWMWFYEKVGKSVCPITDTWWQTETGSVMISPLPGVTTLKPGSAMRPFIGVSPKLLDEEGKEIVGPGTGYLCIDKPWPSIAIGILDSKQGFENASSRFYQKYLSTFPGYYLSGDRAMRDQDNDYWIEGRTDDVIKVSGHRIGSAEIESVLVSYDGIAEASVVGYHHPIKGEGIYAFVSPVAGLTVTPDIIQALKTLVAQNIGKFATPDIIQVAPALPKTRSGKIMRRVLRCIANNEFDSLGDISTLADPEVVEALKKKPPNN